MREAVRVHLVMQALACFAVGLPDARHALRVRRRRQVVDPGLRAFNERHQESCGGRGKDLLPGNVEIDRRSVRQHLEMPIRGRAES